MYIKKLETIIAQGIKKIAIQALKKYKIGMLKIKMKHNWSTETIEPIIFKSPSFFLIDTEFSVERISNWKPQSDIGNHDKSRSYRFW